MDKAPNEIVHRPDLKQLVERAFLNRTREEIAGEVFESGWDEPAVRQGYTNEGIEGAENFKKINFSGTDDNETIEFPPFVSEPNEVTVDELKDYHWLLRYAAEVCTKHVNVELTPALRKKLIKKDLAHELQHALAGKGEDGLNIRYGVAFTESSDGVSWKPRLTLLGKARRGTIKRMVKSTTWLSKADQTALE